MGINVDYTLKQKMKEYIMEVTFSVPKQDIINTFKEMLTNQTNGATIPFKDTDIDVVGVDSYNDEHEIMKLKVILMPKE